ncbi:MAG: dTDP-4-dehydrorhamnose reductase [Actinomycetota bacterium]|nr:dTDP-4-dehydrorhamnose reductase [Actinomycetota bacterium]
MQKILIFGGNGQLGNDFKKYIPDKYYSKGFDRDIVDIRNYLEVENIFKEYNPDFVFNFAAITDVDYCEEHPSEAYETNTMGTKNIAICCKKYGSTLIFISTGAVFSGGKGKPYIETDKRGPINVYGKTKKEAEDIILKTLTKFFIVRCGWLFGGFTKDKKFVRKIADKLLEEEEEICVVNDKYGSPTYTADFSEGLLKIIEFNNYGVYHMVNEGYCSRYECAREIKKILKSNCKIIPVSSENFKLKAKRPTMEAIENYNLNNSGYFKMRKWEVALNDYLKNYLKYKNGRQ